jgi:putative NADH-flavin reductase
MTSFIKNTIILITVVLLSFCLAACVSHPTPTQSQPVPGSATAPKKNITIAMLGATGMAGSFILQEALAQGYDVRALARTPAKLDHVKDTVSVVQGDARDPQALDELLQGSDIVISALGPVKSDGKDSSMISTTVSGHVIKLMPAHSIERYMVVSGAGVNVAGDDRNLTGWLMRKLVYVGLYDTLQDKQAEYQLLADSSIHWTLVRCPLIEPEPFAQAPRASLDTPHSFHLRAGELARFIIEQINSTEFVNKAPFLDSR